MNKIINNLALVADAAEYFNRATSAAWRIRTTISNIAIWQANSYLYAEKNGSERLHTERIKLSTIREWVRDCNSSSFVLDLTPSAVRRTLGLERNQDPHEEACRIARLKCMQTRSAAKFKQYYEAAVMAAEERRLQREENVERISSLLSDDSWELEGEIVDSRGMVIIYDKPTEVKDEELYDEDLMDNELDKLSDVLANALESMYTECERQLNSAIVTAKINRLSGYKIAIAQMMEIVGVDLKALAKRQVALEAQLKEAEANVANSVADLDQQIEAQMASVMHQGVNVDGFCDILAANAEPTESKSPTKMTAAERRARREARLAAKSTE